MNLEIQMATHMQQTSQRHFHAEFARVYFQHVEVTIPPGVSVILVDGKPMVQHPDTDANSTTFGMIMLLTLQQAADMGIVHFMVSGQREVA